MSTILIADDDQLIRRLESDFLKKAGHEVLEAEDGEQALRAFKSNSGIALVMLDIMMPGLDGWEVCREIRKTSSVPVMLVSARAQDFDQITGFEAGADDYVTKPFSPAVLVKRVDALIKRAGAEERNSSGGKKELVFGELTIRPEAHEVLLCGGITELTLKEYNILIKLASAPGRVFTREQLLDEIWGMDYFGDIRTVDSHVARLRTKLGSWGADNIKTVYGTGYKIEAAKS